MRISGSNGTLLLPRGHVELRDRQGHTVLRLHQVAPSVSYALRSAARTYLGISSGAALEPWEAMKDLELVEAVQGMEEAG